MKKLPILCLDFDGVVHSYASGWKGADVIPDPPVEGAGIFLSEAIKHFQVHIYSSRSHQENGCEAMRNWCVEHFGAWLTSQLSFPSYKPSAKVSIDDRAITFTGLWPKMRYLVDFKPWNK